MKRELKCVEGSAPPWLHREEPSHHEGSLRLHQTLCSQLLEAPSVTAFTRRSLGFDGRSITVFYLGRSAGGVGLGEGDAFLCLSVALSSLSLASELGRRSIFFPRRSLQMTDAKSGGERGAPITSGSKAALAAP